MDLLSNSEASHSAVEENNNLFGCLLVVTITVVVMKP